jgi:hypothetical protein
MHDTLWFIFTTPSVSDCTTYTIKQLFHSPRDTEETQLPPQPEETAFVLDSNLQFLRRPPDTC